MLFSGLDSEDGPWYEMLFLLSIYSSSSGFVLNFESKFYTKND